jgi:hypothetical protein
MTNRFLIAPIAIAISAAFIGAAASPAVAAPSGVCTTAPEQIRTAAAAADAEKATKALRFVAVGEKLCEAGGRGEAAKKFAAAAKALGTDLAALNTTIAAK